MMIGPLTPGRLLAASILFSIAAIARAQDAKALVQQAVNVELAADRNDHTAFMYRDHDVTPDHDTLYYVVETPKGSIKKQLEDHGHALTPDEQRADDQKTLALVNDPAAMARLRKDSANDDNQAEKMLRLLPAAFLWTVVSDTNNLVTLSFKPDPAFQASFFDPESKVLGAMGGQITVQRPSMHIASIKGTLLADVNLFGFLGHLRKGGSFEVIRKDFAGGHWQMAEQHIHINGRAVFFKTISTNEDEMRWDLKVSNAQTLQQAYEILKGLGTRD